MNDWVCIYKANKLQDAEIVKGLLTFNEINSVVISKQDSSYNMFGYHEVYVNQEDVVKAKLVMKENDPTS